VVVGAGSAGLFCALGLAERADVVLLEAGPDPGDPAPQWLLEDYVFPAELDWGYTEAGSGMALPRGRLTGGSSSVNSAAALRGQPWCYDGWGVEGWGFEHCLEGFRAIERDCQYADAPWHGDRGPIPIDRLDPGAIDEAFTHVCGQAGHPAVADHNAPRALGIGPWPTNRVQERRWGTHAAVLPLLREQVQVRAGTTATGVALAGKRCVGVDVTGPEGRERLAADLVVLCAGTYGSAELLLRSGIGPAAALRAAGMEVHRDLLGVGARVADHPWCLLDVQSVDPGAPARRPVSGALLRLELPDAAGESHPHHREGQIFPFQSRPYEPDAPPEQVSIGVGLMAPRSRGTLRLTPGGGGGTEIRLGHLSEPADGADLAALVHEAADLVDAMAKEGTVRLPARPWWRTAGPEMPQVLRARATTYHHPVGTCPLGAPDDPGAVVGGDLGVYGVDGLAVADASIMPSLPRANTNLAAMMIGWRAGQLLGR
jgi:choline dehydrogenase